MHTNRQATLATQQYCCKQINNTFQLLFVHILIHLHADGIQMFKREKKCQLCPVLCKHRPDTVPFPESQKFNHQALRNGGMNVEQHISFSLWTVGIGTLQTWKARYCYERKRGHFSKNSQDCNPLEAWQLVSLQCKVRIREMRG